MRKPKTLFLVASSLVLSATAWSDNRIDDVLADPALDFGRPGDVARAAERIRAIENAGLERARAKARAMGIPMREVRSDGTVRQIIGLDENDELVINTTFNVNAAISTGANLIQPAPYSLNGSGLIVGVWDGGDVRTTHQEFVQGTTRVTLFNNVGLSNHATHVAGTIAAFGVDSRAKGMATQARIDSYYFSNINSELTGRVASAPGQAETKIYISNHSYGTVEGWDGNTWRGVGTDQNAYDSQFGQYGGSARDWDNIIYNAPYHLLFKSAGNDNSNNPATGATVTIGGVTHSYNPSIHPPGDGRYRNTTTNAANGYENIGTYGNSKNIMTVGAANDAVTNGLRDPAKSTLTGFSSRGPTDDGRIKPDIVANGAGLFSSLSTGDTAYSGNYSGTSMSAPNASGSATLLVQLYSNLFAGGAMRASTLKGLLIHTATDIGNPGPDYHYGWGLINVKDAADLIIDHQANPSKNRMVEEQLTTAAPTKTFSFTWDGSSPLRATMCWTDPGGTATTAHDSRVSRLVNDLDLKLVAPDGNQYFPFVMPFVGTWTVASMSAHATTGVNSTDNVEQVLIQNPGQTGVWQAVVTYKGALTNNQQRYSLLFSGVSDGIVPLVLNDITPNGGLSGNTVSADITGSALSEVTEIRLRRAGRADILGTSVQMIDATTLRCQFNLTGAASGAWDLVATNPDSETFALSEAFTISGTLSTFWSENFDAFANGAPASGWTSTTSPGTNSWAIVSSPTHPSHSPTKACHVTGPSNNSVTYLTSPPIAIPVDAANLQLEFWHQHDINTRHGGRFSMSIDNGPWFDVTDAGSGAAFTNNGYNSTVAGTGQTSDFANLQAWTGISNGFIRTTVSLNDLTKYTGKNLRLRWGIATNSNQTSAHWYVDSIAMTSDSSAPNQAPVITVAATTDTGELVSEGSTTFHVLRGTATNLSVTATDDAGEEFLTYSWSATGPGDVTYSLNQENASKTTTATFSAIGDHAVTVTALDTGGLFATSTVNVRVLETTEFVVTPNSAILNIGQTQQFTATLIDQFGTPLATQPSPIAWSTTGGGTISTAGLFTAASVGGPYSITASGGGESGSADVSINPTQAGIELDNLSQTYNGTSRVVTATTTPAGLSYSVTYDGQSTPPIDVGSYAVAATITDPNYQGSDSGTLVVDKATQTITFNPLDPVGNDHPPFQLTATTSSGLQTSYTSSNQLVATVSGTTVTVVAAGTTIITASQAGNENFLPATNVAQELVVIPAVPVSSPGGPYKVLVGQTLTLDGSASAPSFGETLTTYEWDLNNDNSFGDVAGPTPTAIPFNDLINLWGMTQGLNAIQLRVTDSAGKTAIATTTVELVSSLQWDANGTIAGQTNGGGAWLGNNLWWDGATNLNWAPGSNAIFGGSSTAGGSVSLVSPTSANSLIFNTFTGTYTLGTAGQAITLNDGISKNAGSGAVAFVGPITLSGAQTWVNQSSGALSTGRNTNLINNNGFQLTVDGTGTTNFGTINNAEAALTGFGDLVKTGAGRLNIGGVNSGFTGNVAINGGVLQVTNNAGALGNGNVAITGGVLSFYWGLSYDRTLGAGDNQVQILGGDSGFAGSGTTGPTLNLGAAVIWGALGENTATGYFNPSRFVLGDSGTGNAGATTFTSGINLNGSTRTIQVPPGTNAGLNRSTISGAISNSTGTAGLIKEGGGWLFLTAVPTYNGITTVSEGFLDFAALNLNSMGGGAGVRSIAVADGAVVRRNNLDNAFLQRMVHTTAEIGVMTGTAGNSLDFSSNTGANLPNAFLGNWAGNGAKTEISGTITPGSNGYLFGASGSSGLLGIRGVLSGANGLTVGMTGSNGIRVNLVAESTFSGDTVINSGSKLTIGNNLALQNSALNVGAAGGSFALAAGTNGGRITGETEASAPTFGGLIGSRNLMSVFTNAASNNETNLAATAVIGFTLNPGEGKSHTYSGSIGEFATGTTLTKSGSGTQILGGNNTYSGATTITAGSLFINGTTAGGAVTVNADAVLGGTGTLGGNTTIATNGQLEFDLSTPAASHDKLDLASARSLTFSGASVLSITTTGGAAPGSYTLITAPGGIGGAAPSTLNLPTNWAATVSIIGNDLVLNVTSIDAGASPYDDWATANNLTGSAADPTADPDNDGVSNLLEFAFGMDPNTSFSGSIVFAAGGSVTTPGLPVAYVHDLTATTADYRAAFGRRKDYEAAGLRYTVEFSSNLNQWVQSTAIPTALTGETIDDIEAVSVSYPLFIPVNGGFEKPRFFRVGVGFVEGAP